MHVRVSRLTGMQVPQKARRRHLILLELELQAAVNCLTWMLGQILRPSAKAAGVLNH